MGGGAAQVGFVGDDQKSLSAHFPPWTESTQNPRRIVVALCSCTGSGASLPGRAPGDVENVRGAGDCFDPVHTAFAWEFVKVGHVTPFGRIDCLDQEFNQEFERSSSTLFDKWFYRRDKPQVD